MLKLALSPMETPAGGQIRLEFTAMSNRSYGIEFRDSLLDGGWSNLMSVDSLPTNRLMRLTNDLPAGTSNRFYRVRVGAFETRQEAERYLRDVARETGAKGFVTPSR